MKTTKDNISCLHLHILCMNCDMDQGHCHCFDGGEWFCQDCNKAEWEFSKDCIVDIDEAKEVLNSHRWIEHQRKLRSMIVK